MIKLLSICSTREHPERCKEMLESFDKTKSEGTEIVLYVWDKDPKIKRYREVLEGRNVIYGPKRFMAEVLNYISTEVLPNVPYYQNINDDHYYVTEGWDQMMMEPLDKNKGWGVSYCKGKGGAHNPNAEIISGKIVRALGFYVYPAYRQFGLEPYVIELGEICGFFYIPEVIEHRSVNAGFGAKDKVYKFIYSPEEMDSSNRAHAKWSEFKDTAIQKIKSAREKDGQ